MINRLKLEKYSALYLWAFFMILFWFWRPDNFMTITSFKLVTQENVIFAELALAFLVPLSTATYDLAIGHQASMALVITNWIAKNTELPQATGILLGLGACLIAGTISGFVVVKLKVDSFIATLGMSQVITAFILYTSEQTISGELSKPYQQFGNAQFLGLQRFVWYMLILSIVVWYVLEHTPLGRQMFATGGNPEAARLTGIRTDRLRWGSLMASSLIAGFAGIIYSWKVGTFASSIGPGYLFPAVAAVFFGASQLKGRPNVWGAVIALYALAWGVKGLQLVYTTVKWIEPLFQGVSLLAAVALASRNQVVRLPKRRRAAGAAPAAVTKVREVEHARMALPGQSRLALRLAGVVGIAAGAVGIIGGLLVNGEWSGHVWFAEHLGGTGTAMLVLGGVSLAAGVGAFKGTSWGRAGLLVFNVFLLVGALQEHLNGGRSIIAQAIVGAVGLVAAFLGVPADEVSAADEIAAPAPA